MNSSFLMAPQHKRSNLSSFVLSKHLQRVSAIDPPPPSAPLLFNDTIIIQSAQTMVLALVSPRNLVPGMTPSNHRRFCLFQLIPSSAQLQGKEVQAGQTLYLRNKQSGLYLTTESQILNEFTNLCFQGDKNDRCLFSLQKEEDQQLQTGAVHNQEQCRLKHVASGLYLRTEPVYNSEDHTLWLGQVGTELVVKVANRSKQLPFLLNDRDIVLLTIESKQERHLLGVQKTKSFCNLLERRDPLGQVEADINEQYNSPGNCRVVEIPEDHTDGSFMSCIWEVLRPSYLGNKELSYVIREDENLALRHVQTGLYLECRNRHEFELREMQQIQGMIGFQNLERFSCDFQEQAHFEPLYIDHLLKIKQTEVICTVSRVQSQTRLQLFLEEWLSLVGNIACLLKDSSKIGEEWENLQEQISYYIYVFKLLQKEVDTVGDGGFYFFQFSLRVLQVIRGMIQRGGEELRRLLGGMLDQMIRFISLVVVGSQVLETITSEDVKKTQQIIYLLFVLYPLNRKYILAVVVCLSSADPQLVVSILGQQLNEAGHFHERVDILEAITDVIDRFRRINFDEEIFERMMSQDHHLQLAPSTLLITFKGKQHDLFELLRRLEQLPCEKSEYRQYEWEQHYEIVYLLKMMRLLYGAKTVTRQSQLTKSKEGNAVHEDHLKNISIQLMTIFLNSSNVQIKNIVLTFLLEFVTQLSEDEFLNASHRFIVFGGEPLTPKTELSSVLRLRKEGTIEWLIGRELFLDTLKQVTRRGWQEGLELSLVLKFLGKLVDFCSLALTTHTYDISALNEIEFFCIAVSTLYYRNKVREGFFLKTRGRICGYQEHKQYLVVQGVKTQLDILIGKLGRLFGLVANFKERLHVHPLLDSPQHTFKSKEFQKMYTRLSLNQRLSLQVPALAKLLALNKQMHEVSAIVIAPENIQHDCLRLLQSAMSDLESLSIIMESFRLYSEKERLKDNMLASMKLKILNIEEAIKSGSKYRQFNKYSDALILPELLLSFILENANETELVQRLAELLLERVATSWRLDQLVGRCREVLKKALVQPKAGKCCRIVLKWLGRQIEKNSHPGTAQNWNFLSSDILEALEKDDQNHSVYFLISLLLELDLCPSDERRQMLYARLVKEECTKEFLKSCSSSQTLKVYRDRIQRDALSKFNMQLSSLELVLLFRLADGQPKMMKHLESLVPLKQIKDCLFNSDHYFFFRAFLTYLSCHSSLFQDAHFTNEILIYGMRIIRGFREHTEQLQKYQPRVGEKEKDNKSVTHFDKKYSNREQKNNNLQATVDQQQEKKHYWQFLFWIPYYQRPQGLLVCLQKVLRKVVGHRSRSQDIVDSLKYLEDSLEDLRKSKEVQVEQFRIIGEQINLLMGLLALRKEEDRVLEEDSELEGGRGDGRIEQVYKILVDSDMLKGVVGQLTKELTVEQMVPESRSARSLKSQKSRKSQKSQKSYLKPIQIEHEIMSESINSNSQQECTHHQLIRPSRLDHSPSIRHQKARKIRQKTRESRSKSIILFLDRLKVLFRHRIRLSVKVETHLLKYFMEEGTFFGLYSGLLEEINTARYKAITYKDDNLDYPWNWRTVPARIQSYLYREHDEASVQRGETTVNLEIDRLVQTLETHPSQTLRHIYELLQAKDPQSLSETVVKDCSGYFRLFISLLNSQQSQQSEVSLIIWNCSYLLDLFLRFNEKDYFIARKDSILQAISFSAQKMENIPVTKQNHPLFIKFNIFFCTALNDLLRDLNPILLEANHRATLSRLPKTVYRHILLKFVELRLNLTLKDPSVQVEPVQFLFQELREMFMELQGGNLMQIENNFEYFKIVFDFMLVRLNQSQGKGPQFPPQLFRLLITLETILYRQLSHHEHSIRQSRLRDLQQLIIIDLLCLFHTVSVKQGDNLDASLFQQREPYLENDINNEELKAIYQYYEKHYEWCMVGFGQGKVAIQVYPKKKQSNTWKNEIKDVIGSESQITKRKEMLLDYCLNLTPELKEKEEAAQKLDYFEPIALLISLFCVALGLGYKVAFNILQRSTFFEVLIIVHLLLFCFVMFCRYSMIRAIGEVEKLVGRQASLLCYVVKTRLGLSLFFLLIIVFTGVSFYMNGTAALILWEILLFKSSGSLFIFQVAKRMRKTLVILTVIFLSLLLFLAMTLYPDQGQFIYPILNMTTFYDYSFTLPFIQSWSTALWGSFKSFSAIIFMQMAAALIVAFSIYEFMQQSALQRASEMSCLFCNKFQSETDDRHSSQQHIALRHNMFRFIEVFRHILFLKEECMSLQQKRIRQMIEARDLTVFN